MKKTSNFFTSFKSFEEKLEKKASKKSNNVIENPSKNEKSKPSKIIRDLR